tara:strand:+ start:646 stop:840 length:195 start_codon:yes stop_codon:yes gene_type:complete
LTLEKSNKQPKVAQLEVVYIYLYLYDKAQANYKFSNNKAQASKPQATGVVFTPQVTSDCIWSPV